MCKRLSWLSSWSRKFGQIQSHRSLLPKDFVFAALACTTCSSDLQDLLSSIKKLWSWDLKGHLFCMSCGQRHYLSLTFLYYSISFYHMTLFECGICCRHVSVLPSVTSWHCTKTANRGIIQTTPHDGPGILVFWRQRSHRNSNGFTPNAALNRGGVGSDRRFLTSVSLYLKNGSISGHSYFRTIIGTRICTIEWRYFQWPCVT